MSVTKELGNQIGRMTVELTEIRGECDFLRLTAASGATLKAEVDRLQRALAAADDIIQQQLAGIKFHKAETEKTQKALYEARYGSLARGTAGTFEVYGVPHLYGPLVALAVGKVDWTAPNHSVITVMLPK